MERCRISSLASLSSFALSFFAVIVACSTGEKGFDPKADIADVADATSNTLPFADGGSTGSLCKGRCSDDLHAIVDCDGQVVKSCAAKQLCGDAECVEPCEAMKRNKSSIGCEYFAMQPPGYTDDQGDCFATFVVNTWNEPVTLHVERANLVLNPATFAKIPHGEGGAITYTPLENGSLAPGEIAILFLAASPNAPVQCPTGITPAVVEDASVTNTGFGSAFRISASAPVVAYDIFPYGGGNSAITSASLLLPTPVWGTNYIGIDAYATFDERYNPWIAVVAMHDATSVTISPSSPLVGGEGIDPRDKWRALTVPLAKGQFVQLGQRNELQGSTIVSDKPVGVFGGASCMDVPIHASACDSGHQQIPPIRALGHEYVAVKHRDRFASFKEAPPWRIVGAVDATALTYEPKAPPGAPSVIHNGQSFEFTSETHFLVRSQDADHPFYIAGYMTGCSSIPDEIKGQDNCVGDPEFVNVIPPAQYLKEYTFFTDPTYPETSLVVVRTKTPGGFKDVELDCAGKLQGWKPVTGDYEYTYVDLVRGNFEKQGACDNGRHTMKSDAPFGVTVWGWGSGATKGKFRTSEAPGFYTQCVSYAYPAGARVQEISSVFVSPRVP